MSNDNSEVRQKIISVARNKFFNHGIKNITMDEIASEVGIGKGTLYEYFSSKTKLIEEIVRVKNSEMWCYYDRLNEKLSQEKNINFLELLEEIIEESSKNLSEIKISFHKDIKKLNSETRKKMEDMNNMGLKLAKTILTRGKKEGMIKKDINEEVALEIVSIGIQHMIINHKTAIKLNISSQDVFNTFVSILFDGTLSDKGKKHYDKMKNSD